MPGTKDLGGGGDDGGCSGGGGGSHATPSRLQQSLTQPHPSQALPPEFEQLPGPAGLWLSLRDVHGAEVGASDLPVHGQGQGRRVAPGTRSALRATAVDADVHCQAGLGRTPLQPPEPKARGQTPGHQVFATLLGLGAWAAANSPRTPLIRRLGREGFRRPSPSLGPWARAENSPGDQRRESRRHRRQPASTGFAGTRPPRRRDSVLFILVGARFPGWGGGCRGNPKERHLPGSRRGETAEINAETLRGRV